MIEQLGSAEVWVALASLTALEIVLGIDNIVFIAILTGRLPERQRKLAYRLGLSGALVTRVALLFAISWVMQLDDPWLEPFGKKISGRDLILLAGGLFLMAKSAIEVFNKVEGHDLGEEGEEPAAASAKGFAAVVGQVALLDIVFSLDSVITAVGMVDEVWIMVTAVVIAIGIMLVFAKKIGDFVNRHPSMKILALSFLLMIGVLLVAQGWGAHLNKGYVYFAMGYALVIDLLNMRFRKKNPDAVAAEVGLDDSK